MRRKIMSDLKKWKKSRRRKPLILWGARQVGKTWALREFGRQYFDNTVYISFYNNQRMADVFVRDYDVERILSALCIMTHEPIEPGKTLLIFDEVQNAPRVVEALKYFCEEAAEYHVVAAGSLLGVSLHEGISFPVGKVDELHLYPMSFREFLWALGEEALASFADEPERNEVNDFREQYVERLRQYFVVGGMPEAVESYRVNRDFVSVREIQNAIVHQYEGDFGKHVSAGELPRIRMVWNSLPVQLAKENKKFFYGKIKEGARAREYEIALQWLSDAGLVHRIHKVSKPALPLKAYTDPQAFKVYLVDIGLLGALSDLDPQVIVSGDEVFSEFKGALTEQYVLQQLLCETSYSLYYYASEKSRYEVDFLFQKEGGPVPLEVKAVENLRAKSLRVYCEKYKPAQAIRTSLSGYRKEDWMVNIPLWAVQGI